MPFDYPAMQATADELIAYFGMGAVLRRITASPTDRPCTVAIVEYDPREQPNELTNPTDRRVVMSAANLSEPPDDEQDALVTFVQPPPGSLASAGTNPPV